MNCTICHNPVVLMPSAKERAMKFGGKPSDYTNLFTAHSSCQLEQRKEATTELMQKRNEEYDKTHPNPNVLVPHIVV